MKQIITFILMLGCSYFYSQEITNGTYTFDIAFAENGGSSLACSCKIIINGDSIKIINNGTLSSKKGEIIDEGILMKHKSGKWIIGHSESDSSAEDVGGCSGGPLEIDLINKKLWLC